jgi:hypothetical protein
MILIKTHGTAAARDPGDSFCCLQKFSRSREFEPTSEA